MDKILSGFLGQQRFNFKWKVNGIIYKWTLIN